MHILTGQESNKRGGIASVILATAFFLCGGREASAQTAVVAYNANAEYQKLPHAKVKRVLLYNFTYFAHSKTPALNSWTRLAKKYGFQLDVTESQSYITTATLQDVSVAVFTNGDGDVLSNATSLAAMKNFVEVRSKGLLQTHAAAAYIPCPAEGEENLPHANCKWLARVLVRQYFHHNNDNTPARIYADSVKAGQIPPGSLSGTAASVLNHGRSNPETVNIFKGLPKNGLGTNPNQEFVWDQLGCEWYNYRGNPRIQGAQTFDGVSFGPINILLSLDEASYAETSPSMGDHPMAWARKVGNGLTAYNNAGHSDIYTRARGTVRDSLIEKINWNIIRYLARDYVGCMDATKAAYNPDASIAVLTPGLDPADPCAVTSALQTNGKASANIVVESNRIVVPTIERETYRILATNSKGQKVFSATIPGGPGQNIAALENKKGAYFIEVESPKIGKTVTKVNLK